MNTTFKSIIKTSILLAAISLPLTGVITATAKNLTNTTATIRNLATTNYKSETIDGVKIAYREAGDPAKPTILLLHGFPTSSHMFRHLIPKLSSSYHVIAPDYPGFGASDAPAVDKFDYSFKHIAQIMSKLLEKKQVNRYAVYLMDYGAPIGYRMFASHPERVTGFIIQNGNAYEEGLKEFWDPIKAYWKKPSKENGDKLRAFLTIGATKWQFTHGTKHPENINPDNFWHVQYLLDRPGNQDIQLKMFLDYSTNVPEYKKWQALFRKHQTPALLMWGKNDHIFPEAGAKPYKRDLKNLEYHILDTGHFALEEHGPFMATRILSFMDKTTR